MTAAELKRVLRGRHPATQQMGGKLVPGAWTTIEEFMEIDLLAFSSHASPATGGMSGVRYPRVGYEVKVSRSDLRRELLRPAKRVRQVAWCHAFYFAVPKGLLKPEELAFKEPTHFGDFRSFQRTLCPGRCQKNTSKRSAHYGIWQRYDRDRRVMVNCTSCDNKGYIALSRVEIEAPTLWIPADVGLIEVGEKSTKVFKRSPVRKRVPSVSGEKLSELVRWASARPDPRHQAL